MTALRAAHLARAQQRTPVRDRQCRILRNPAGTDRTQRRQEAADQDEGRTPAEAVHQPGDADAVAAEEGQAEAGRQARRREASHRKAGGEGLVLTAASCRRLILATSRRGTPWSSSVSWMTLQGQ